MQERAEKIGVFLRVISPAWIPKVEIPGLHSSTRLYLQCPIFEHDLQQYHTLPIAGQHPLCNPGRHHER